MKRIMGNKYGIKSSNSNQSNELKFLRMMKELNIGLSLASADFDASYNTITSHIQYLDKKKNTTVKQTI